MAAKLEGKVAAITGAGSGIGRAMAFLFASEGASVVVDDIIPERVDEVVSHINSANGKAVGIVADVALESDVRRIVNIAVDTYGRLDIICNNAGIMDRMLPVTELTDELWEKVFSTNLAGPIRACRIALPIMLNQGSGVILNTASVAGQHGGIAGTAYTVTKHGLIGLTKNVAWTYADKGIRCNAICPGGVITNIGLGGDPSELGVGRMQLGAGTMPRLGTPEEIASIALTLVSDDCSFVNGAVLVADGGWTAY